MAKGKHHYERLKKELGLHTCVDAFAKQKHDPSAELKGATMDYKSSLQSHPLAEYEAPSPLPETTENAVCALGLIVALVGIIAGTVFIIKGVRKANTAERRGPL